MAAAQRKQDSLRSGQPAPGLPSLQQHHHQLSLPGPQSGPLPSHPPPMGGRPSSLERAHTFPTPPTSASSVMGGMGNSENFQWGQQGMSNGQATGHMSIDTNLSNNARSLPNTPATTPPGSTLQSMQNYPPVSQPYDNSRQMYQAPPSAPAPYPPSNPAPQERPMYNHGNYVKSEMAPPSSRPGGQEQADSKPANGIMHAGQSETVASTGAEDEAEHEHDGEYTHDSGAYDTSRSSYNYSAPPAASLPNDHSHLSPEMSGSPHQAGSGRATPRTAAAPQSYYAPQGYNTPPRVGQPSSNLYSVMSNERGPTNGSSANDVYGNQGEMGSAMQNGYATQPPVQNGAPSMKRGRDDDDDRPTSGGTGMPLDLKRRKTMLDNGGSMPSPTYNPPMAQAVPAITTSQRRR